MDDTGDNDMEALRKDNVVKIVRPQTPAEQEKEATRRLIANLEDIAQRFRLNLKSIIHSYRETRIEKANLAMRVLFLEGELRLKKKHIKEMYRLYRTAHMDLIAARRAHAAKNGKQ